jgi:hypothetical protein
VERGLARRPSVWTRVVEGIEGAFYL